MGWATHFLDHLYLSSKPRLGPGDTQWTKTWIIHSLIYLISSFPGIWKRSLANQCCCLARPKTIGTINIDGRLNNKHWITCPLSHTSSFGFTAVRVCHISSIDIVLWQGIFQLQRLVNFVFLWFLENCCFFSIFTFFSFWFLKETYFFGTFHFYQRESSPCLFVWTVL